MNPARVLGPAVVSDFFEDVDDSYGIHAVSIHARQTETGSDQIELDSPVRSSGLVSPACFAKKNS